MNYNVLPGGEKLSYENLLKAVKSGPPRERWDVTSRKCLVSTKFLSDFIRVFTNVNVIKRLARL